MDPDFRSILINSSSSKELRGFRNTQRWLFKTHLKDTIYRYSDSMLQSREDKISYAKSFYDCIKWKQPLKKELDKLLTFPNNYATLESSLAMMSETD